MKPSRLVLLLSALVAAGGLYAATHASLVSSQLRARGVAPRTVDEVLAGIGAEPERRLRARSEAAGVAWPPARTTWIAIKDERRLEAWVAGPSSSFAHLATYGVLAASGGPGPKRREGDRQVPEGVYALTTLNPNSRFHLSVRVDYPNDEDIAHRVVPREQMGGDIFVHGSDYSVGCLAVGDEAIEELFVLAARVPEGRREIIVMPTDLRAEGANAAASEPWMRARYERLAEVVAAFPRPQR
jgi:hypothetical protein